MGLTFADDEWRFTRHLAIRPFTNLFLEMQTPGSFDRFFGMRSNFRVFVDALLYRYMENHHPLKKEAQQLWRFYLPFASMCQCFSQSYHPDFICTQRPISQHGWKDCSMSVLQIASKKLVWAIMPSGRGSPATSGHKSANWELLHPFKSKVSFFFGAGKLLPPTETLRDIFCRLPFRPKDRTFLCLFSLGPNLSLAAGNMPKKAVRNLQPHHPQEKRETTKLRNCKDSYFYV